MKRKLNLLFFLIIALNFSCLGIDKKEASSKVSFLLFQKDSIIANRLFSQIHDLYESREYPLAVQKSLEFLKLYENDFTEKAIEIKILLGEITRKNNSIDKSISYYLGALKQLNEMSLDNKSVDLDYSIGPSIYLKLGNVYLLEYNIDSAKYYYKKVLEFESLNPKVLSYQGSASSNLSGIYMQDSLYNDAKLFALKAVEIHSKRNNNISEAAALGNLANIYLNENNYNDARETYKEAINLVKNESSDRGQRVKEDLYFNLAYNLRKLEDFRAYDNLEQSYAIKDSLRDKEIRAMIEDITDEFNFEAKKELLLRDEENKRLKAQRTFSIIGIFAILIIISLLYWLKLNQLKLQKTEVEKNQELAKVKSELQTKVLNATIDGREIERKDIAETLHDSVSALLSSANLHLQATRRKINGEAPEEIDKTQKIIHEATDKIRDLSHTLVSSVLLKFGLKYAINEMAEKYSNSELEITSSFKNVRRYHQRFEIKVHNIIQEFVNNIIKHSKATNASVAIREVNDKLIISVIDNGVGFDKSQITQKDGLGINQIEARIQMMHGKFQIESSRKSGTHIYMEVPVVEKETISFDYQAL